MNAQIHTRIILYKPSFRLRAGASTRVTSTSTSSSTCNMCEYEYESEYLIITWVRVRVLVDEYEYKCEYCSMINILYSMYRQQIFIVWCKNCAISWNVWKMVYFFKVWNKNFHILTRSWMRDWTWTNDNNKHKYKNSDSVNFSMMIKLKECMGFVITSHVSYIQIIAN